jgi:methylthioribose-1-phosphate isomerase
MKEDIREADELTSDILRKKLERMSPPGKDLPIMVFVDSFLTNEKIIASLQGYQLNNVVTGASEAKPNEIQLFDAARVLRQSRLLIISADAVLRNGGVLGKSGSLMLTVLAHQLGVPVLAVSRSYCLSEQLFLNQESLVHEQSSRGLFDGEDEANFRVQVCKRYDYIEPRLVSGVVGERKGWESQNIIEIFEDYYQ